MRKRDLFTRYRGDRQFGQWVTWFQQMVAHAKVSARDLVDAAIVVKVLEQERIEALITPPTIQ